MALAFIAIDAKSGVGLLDVLRAQLGERANHISAAVLGECPGDHL